MLDRSGFALEFDEDFAGAELDPGRWVDHYLPHWTTPERSAARYELDHGVLRLRIDADQPAWRPEDGEMRVSSLQTGAFWLAGFEEAGPEESGELCVAELFGTAIAPHRAGVRIGVKAHDDLRLREDMEEVTLDLDATDWHTYAVAWDDLFEVPEGPERDAAGYPKTAEVRAVRGYRPVI